MTSKKKVSQTQLNPILDFTKGLPENVTQAIAQIPNYDDVGISFKGYSKTMTSSNQYQLNKQRRRFGYIGVDETLPPSGASTYTFSRSNQLFQDPKKTFYVTTIQIDVNQSTSPFDLIIYSGNTNVPRYRVHLDAGEKHIVVNLDNSPRDFTADEIILWVDPVLSAGNFVWVGLYGWEE